MYVQLVQYACHSSQHSSLYVTTLVEIINRAGYLFCLPGVTGSMCPPTTREQAQLAYLCAWKYLHICDHPCQIVSWNYHEYYKILYLPSPMSIAYLKYS